MEPVRQNPPSVLFIIGNGFDLGLGMKTSYSDIYESYLKKASPSAVIEKFKMDLSQRAPYDKWSDFEMGMAEYAQTLVSEEALIECVRDFKKHMVAHLESENEKMFSVICDDVNIADVLAEWFCSLQYFYSCFSPNVVSEIKKCLNKSTPIYRFLTFNYTEILEAIFSVIEEKYKKRLPEPLHIHGMLCQDVVLGVDNISQLQNLPYPLTQKAKRAFIKPTFIEQYDKARIEAARRMISESSVICTYGFSWGESDRRWIDFIIEWLKMSSLHHLVVYQYDPVEYNRFNFDEVMDTEERKKEDFIKKLGIESEALYDQIHIPVGEDIFNFNLKPKKHIIENTLPVCNS